MPDEPPLSLSLPGAVLQSLLDQDVREFIVCAGARNSALVIALASAPGVRLWHHFEERSAAFFALGRILAHENPVAVVTTSGTAVAELFPAIIEAHYQGLPLVALTADRPASYRGTGAPQAIEQAGIFGKYPAVSLDISGPCGLTEMSSWTRQGPLHLNVCLEEPAAAGIPFLRKVGASLLPAERDTSSQNPFEVKNESITDWSGFRNPLVLVGDLLLSERGYVELFLRRLGAPVYAEASSGLRESAGLSHLLLSGGDTSLKKIPHDSVIRIGGVPACRYWRDLEARLNIPVISFTRSGHRGLARVSRTLPLSLKFLSGFNPGDSASSPAIQKIPEPDLTACLHAHPASEPAMIRALSSLIPPAAVVFTGNSLAIREWNLCADPDIPRHARALRGANGIDGNLSAFLGLATGAPEAWCLVGDLTALYDLAAPWMLPQVACPKIRFVVIQNAGGKIFSRLPALRGLTELERRLMENPHRISLEGWARQWNLGHYVHQGALTKLPPLPAHCVLELYPDSGATEAFWRDWSRF